MVVHSDGIFLTLNTWVDNVNCTCISFTDKVVVFGEEDAVDL
jgi:hypothetical protein